MKGPDRVGHLDAPEVEDEQPPPAAITSAIMRSARAESDSVTTHLTATLESISQSPVTATPFCDDFGRIDHGHAGRGQFRPEGGGAGNGLGRLHRIDWFD